MNVAPSPFWDWRRIQILTHWGCIHEYDIPSSQSSLNSSEFYLHRSLVSFNLLCTTTLNSIIYSVHRRGFPLWTAGCVGNAPALIRLNLETSDNRAGFMMEVRYFKSRRFRGEKKKKKNFFRPGDGCLLFFFFWRSSTWGMSALFIEIATIKWNRTHKISHWAHTLQVVTATLGFLFAFSLKVQFVKINRKRKIVVD